MHKYSKYDRLKSLVRQGAGEHYKSPAWRALCSQEDDWGYYYPEIDRSGEITGRLVEDEEGYLNVGHEAMISEDEADAGVWIVDLEERTARQRRY